VLTFGFDGPDSLDTIGSAADSIRCPHCRVDLHYDRVWLSHLGDYSCPGCGLARPRPDVAVTAVSVLGSDRTTLSVSTPSGMLDLDLPQGGVHVAYNAAAALAAASALGVDVLHAAGSLAAVRPAFGRLETLDAGGRPVTLAFAKNPTSFNTTLHTVMADGGPAHLMLAVSNTGVDGEDFGWLWDVEVEPLAERVTHLTLAGGRADELATRAKYAGVPESATTVITDPVQALDDALAALPDGERLVVVAGYTPTIQVREAMRRRGWTNRYWQS
jgi:UDP-N-acetylmuramyl tripeptide synthase